MLEKKFDVTLKSLLEDSPEDWPILAGVHEPRVEVIDADVSTISGAADKVLRLYGPPPSLMHLEFQAGPDASLPRRMNVYNAALEDRHDLPVASVAVLLRPEANLRLLTGLYQRQPAAGIRTVSSLSLPGDSRLAAAGGVAAERRAGAIGSRSGQRRGRSRVAGRAAGDEASGGAGARSGPVRALVDGGVRADGHALSRHGGGTIAARSSRYGRIHDVSGHRSEGSCPGSDGRSASCCCNWDRIVSAQRLLPTYRHK